MSNRKALLAIDPGKSGGIAWTDFDSGKRNAYRMPDTPKDLYQSICDYWPGEILEIRAYIEKVGPMPHDGRASLWKFANHVGHIEMGVDSRRHSV